MTNLDYYLDHDHSARRKTTLLAVAAGSAVGMLLEWQRVPLKTAACFCILTIGTVEIVRAWRYVQPSEKKKPAIELPVFSRRSLIFLSLSAVLFLVFALVPVPTVEAAILDRKLRQAVKKGPPYSEVKKLLLVALNNGIVVRSTTLDTTRRTITEAYLALSKQEQEETGFTLSQIAAYDVYIRTHVRLKVSFPSVFFPDGTYRISSALQTRYVNLIGQDAQHAGFIVDFDFTETSPALLRYGKGCCEGDTVAGYFFAKRPFGRTLSNAPAFILIDGDDHDRKVAVVEVIVSNLSQALDTIIWSDVTFEGCHISYHGGPLLLKNVVFKQCEFDSGDVLDKIRRFGDNPVTLP